MRERDRRDRRQKNTGERRSSFGYGDERETDKKDKNTNIYDARKIGGVSQTDVSDAAKKIKFRRSKSREVFTLLGNLGS